MLIKLVLLIDYDNKGIKKKILIHKITLAKIFKKKFKLEVYNVCNFPILIKYS